MSSENTPLEIVNDSVSKKMGLTAETNGVHQHTTSKVSTAFERWLIQKLLKSIGDPQLAVELWDGQIIRRHDNEMHRIRITKRSSLWKIILSPDFEFAERYVKGEIQIENSLTELLEILFQAWRDRESDSKFEKLLTRLSKRSRSLTAARDNVHQHYDLGNDFYRLWLDEQMLYTCAYFESPEASLEEAQIAKMDYICRKLCLRPGDRVIEAGCGWGALAMHMARHYGVSVIAYNISPEQLSFARSQARRTGLSQKVSFIEDDWRNIRGECDAFVSVGMLEHVGPENYQKFGQIIRDSLTPHGRGLIHSIGVNWQRPLDRWTACKIFPGAQPPSLQQAMELFEPNELNVFDIENLQSHYALTLRHWLDRFEQSAETVRQMFDEEFVRMWRFYLSSSIAVFQTGWLQLYQILFAPPTSHSLPSTRNHIYK